jgi:hypothetical protein
MAARKAAVKRRRKGVEFMAGLGNGSSFFSFKKRDPAGLPLEHTPGSLEQAHGLQSSDN